MKTQSKGLKDFHQIREISKIKLNKKRVKLAKLAIKAEHVSKKINDINDSISQMRKVIDSKVESTKDLKSKFCERNRMKMEINNKKIDLLELDYEKQSLEDEIEDCRKNIVIFTQRLEKLKTLTSKVGS